MKKCDVSRSVVKTDLMLIAGGWNHERLDNGIIAYVKQKDLAFAESDRLNCLYQIVDYSQWNQQRLWLRVRHDVAKYSGREHSTLARAEVDFRLPKTAAGLKCLRELIFAAKVTLNVRAMEDRASFSPCCAGGVPCQKIGSGVVSVVSFASEFVQQIFKLAEPEAGKWAWQIDYRATGQIVAETSEREVEVARARLTARRLGTKALGAILKTTPENSWRARR